MRNESDFNRFLAKEFRKLSPNLHFLKASDKFTAGVSDFIIWYHRASIALESKFISKWPSNNSLLLRHPFTGAQQTFLESVYLTGNKGFGIVGIGEDKSFIVIPEDQIPRSGNWNVEEFKNMPYDRFSFKEVKYFLDSWL